MGKCCYCHIEVLDETDTCPLCRAVLTPTDDLENMYPNVRFRIRRLMFFSRIYLFCALLAQGVLIAVNYFAESRIWWSVITGLILLYGYLILRFTILGKAGHRGKILTLAFLAVFAAIIIDFVTGYRGWSVDYVMPAGILLVDTIIIGCMIGNRRNWQSYIMWQLFMILCSFFPAGLFIVGLERSGLIAFLPLSVSAALFLGTMIIGGNRAHTELRRRFHIN